MDERQKIQQLFLFDLWSTRALTDLLTENGPFENRSLCAAYLSHIVSAQKVWFSRVVENTADRDLDIWAEYELGGLKQKAEKSTRAWIDLIGDHEVDLDSLIYYKNSKGLEFHNSIWEISNHIIIHGQHHRAQISIFLRNSGIQPPPIDYIHFSRNRVSSVI